MHYIGNQNFKKQEGTRALCRSAMNDYKVIGKYSSTQSLFSLNKPKHLTHWIGHFWY